MNYKSYLPLSMALAMLFSCEKPILNEEDANDTPKTITFQLFSPCTDTFHEISSSYHRLQENLYL